MVSRRICMWCANSYKTKSCEICGASGALEHDKSAAMHIQSANLLEQQVIELSAKTEITRRKLEESENKRTEENGNSAAFQRWVLNEITGRSNVIGELAQKQFYY